MNYKDMMNAINGGRSGGLPQYIYPPQPPMRNITPKQPPPIGGPIDQFNPPSDEIRPVVNVEPDKPRRKYEPVNPGGVPDDIEGKVIVDLIKQYEERKRPLRGIRNEKGTWTLENGMVVSNNAFIYLRKMGIVSGGMVSGPALLPIFRPPFFDLPYSGGRELF